MRAARAAFPQPQQSSPHHLPWQHLSMPVHMRRFFGGAFGGGFGFGGGDEEEQTPKGHDVRVDLEVSLRDLYVGTTIRVRPGQTCTQMVSAAAKLLQRERKSVRGALRGGSLLGGRNGLSASELRQRGSHGLLSARAERGCGSGPDTSMCNLQSSTTH